MSAISMDQHAIDQMLKAADATFSSFKFGETLMHLLQTNSDLTLDQIEVRLRAINAKTHLVARPSQMAPSGLKVMSFQTNKAAPFWLWICLHGKEEAAYLRVSLGLSEPDNLAALKTCGFLVTDKTPPGFKVRHDA